MEKRLPQHNYIKMKISYDVFYCNRSRHGNVMTPLRFYLSLCFSVPGLFKKNCLREFVPAIIGSIMAKFEQIL